MSEERRTGHSRLVYDKATQTIIAPEVDAALRDMAAAADALIGMIDKQTYDEYRRCDWDPPEDCEFLITFKAKELVLLDKILTGYVRAADKARVAIRTATADGHREHANSSATAPLVNSDDLGKS